MDWSILSNCRFVTVLGMENDDPLDLSNVDV